MALDFRPGPWEEYGHTCRLPWPKDPEIPEGHACECGRRWVYQQARWDPLCTLEELRVKQEAGEFLRGIIPRFPREPQASLASSADSPDAEATTAPDDDTAVIVPIPAPRPEPRPLPPAS